MSLIFEVDSNVTAKVSSLASAMARDISDADCLNEVYNGVIHALDDLKMEIASGFLKLDTSRIEPEQQHAIKCSEAKAKVLSILQKLQLFSTYLTNLSSAGFLALQNFFHDFSEILSQQTNTDQRMPILSFIIENFKSRANKFVTLMTTHRNMLSIPQTPEASNNIVFDDRLSIKW